MRSNDLPFEKKRIVVLHDAGWLCAYCGGEANEADHIWPKKWGGSDDLENLQALCRSCNAKKGDSIYLTDITPARIELRLPLEIKGARGWVLAAARWKSTLDAMVEQGLDPAPAYRRYFEDDAQPAPDAIRWVLAQLWMELLDETPGHAALDALAELGDFRIVDVLDEPSPALLAASLAMFEQFKNADAVAASASDSPTTSVVGASGVSSAGVDALPGSTPAVSGGAP